MADHLNPPVAAVRTAEFPLLASLLAALSLTAAPAAQSQTSRDLLFRRIDGIDPLHASADTGAAQSMLRRLFTPDYADRFGAPAGADRPGPRAVSQLVCAQYRDRPTTAAITDFVWQWGQFLDHDIDLSHHAEPVESFPVVVPTGDPWFDPFGSGAVTIELSRSAWLLDPTGVRQQTNAITAWIDASNVYGSDAAHATELRAAGGHLLMGADGLLPDDPSTGGRMFLAGDERANENVGLTAMHTLFAREHNLWVDVLAGVGVVGEDAYQIARLLVGAEMQAITYNEFLPIVLGRDALPPYRGWRSDLEAGIANAFSTAAYRFGHTMLSPQLRRLDAGLRTIPAGDLALRDAFFAPDEIRAHGIEPLLRGLANQRPQAIDVHIIDDVRNFLFGQPGAGGFDLAALNIQRGRDHGLPDYVAVRAALGLPPVRDFADITRDRNTRDALRDAYGSVDRIDLWVGGLAEDPVPAALVGPTIRAILRDQFRRLRDGDRFWYQRHLPPEWVTFVERRRLSDIIRANTDVGSELQGDVFRLGNTQQPRRHDPARRRDSGGERRR